MTRYRHREIANSRHTKDYINIDSVTADGDRITVEYGSGGSYSGTPWTRYTTESIPAPK